VTAGYMRDQTAARVLRKMDAANVDLKAFTEDSTSGPARAPERRARDARLPRARDRSLVRDHDAPHPRPNDSDAEIDAECRWIATELGRTFRCTLRLSIPTTR